MQPSSEGHLPLDGPHWTFALDLYQRPGIADTCLLLQDAAGIDISFLLFVLFVTKEHRAALDQTDLAKLDEIIAPWRDEVIRPLRSLRRRIKGGPSPAPSPATEALRDRIKAAEIHAEQIELAVLAQWLERNTPKANAAPIDIAALVDHLIGNFPSRTDRPTGSRSPEIRSALDVIVRALSSLSRV
jgi:uncharacterized protein (TIGR02444 family)